MKRASIAMSAWLLLFGCDDAPPEQHTFEANGHTYTATKDPDPGCSEDGAMDIERDDGKKGRMTIKWDEYVPGVMMALISIGFAVYVARRRVI